MIFQFQKRKKIIKIAGGGLAGLTAAINLSKAGFRVKVYEKSSQIGGHYKENAQMLPNWFSKEDVIEELEKCNLKINWLEKIEEVKISLRKQKVIFYSKKNPVGYSILRGGENSLEKDLAQQAKSLGVEIITNWKGEIDNKINIIATGLNKILTIGYGRVYKGKFEPSKVKVFFSPQYTPTFGYCYLFPHNENIATIKISKEIKEKQINLKENFKKLQRDYLSKEIEEKNFLYDFGSKRSFEVPKSAVKNHSFLVGEAAGFQDELFRFGMRYAIISGHLAAKAIMENLNYDRLWKKRFLEEFQRTARVRRIFQDFKSKGFGGLPKDSEIFVEIEKFKKLWLSRKFNTSLSFYPLYKNFLFNKFILKTLLKLF